ncbi:MAG TPA: ATP synthase F1 subunit delta, partial [Fimbriimonas sp.]|nr:ATP synthase F1 subunit delta [Fimbriimonas sp.]
MQDNRVARRYAQALYETAVKYGTVGSIEDDLTALGNLLEQDKGFRHFFLAPSTSRAEKLKIVEKLFSDRVTAITMQLIRVMLEKGRETEVEGVRSEFSRLRRDAEGIVFATVTSAVALTDKQRSSLLSKLEATQGKKFEAQFEVDPHV